MSASRTGKGEDRQEQQIRFSSSDLAEAVIQTVDQPLLILDSDFTVRESNAAFCDFFNVSMEETRHRPLFEIGNGQWDISELRDLLEKVLPQRSTVTNYRVEHKFPDIGKQIMILNAKRLAATEDRPELILLALSDQTRSEQARFELEGHKEFQEKLIDSVREALLVLDWDLRVVQANQSFYKAFGVSASESEGRLIYELGNGQWDIPHLRKLLENVLPDDNAFNDVEVEHVFENVGRRIMLLNGRRLDHLDLILLAIRDVTELRRMEAQQRTLVGELHHRIKNILTSVAALANQILRESSSLDEFKDAFQTRLAALARTQDLLLRAPDRDTDMADILRTEFEAQGGREGVNFHLAGPEILLPPQAAQAFAMAIHELVTNAVKHGALASRAGKVTIDWSLRAEGEGNKVRFHWRERCADIDTDPDRKGYGSRVVDSVFRHSLKGMSQLTLHPDGAELIAEFRPS
ncbi:sensor histidine kinase [Allomesorhizobium camelthorni]|uniref:Blue-light-activated histidine kinase n=1 Tax=Allomesorhizobium camelthorni TaxID=475069 RepID=A0A6G4WIL6_9HYPH|nr:HWE histidine kinase domain-containing protein [Mesorhizobium camelthorni]NGO54642.1 PAS domain-containing protein [Mesorhizobium camelthorni]